MAAAPETHRTGKVGHEVIGGSGFSGLGMSQGHLPVIMVHDKPSLAKQSQTLDEHSQFEVQENPSQEDAQVKFSPGRDLDLTEPKEGSGQGRMGLTIACLFPLEGTSKFTSSFLYLVSYGCCNKLPPA